MNPLTLAKPLSQLAEKGVVGEQELLVRQQEFLHVGDAGLVNPSELFGELAVDSNGCGAVNDAGAGVAPPEHIG